MIQMVCITFWARGVREEKFKNQKSNDLPVYVIIIRSYKEKPPLHLTDFKAARYLRAKVKACASTEDPFLSEDAIRLWQLYSTKCRPNRRATYFTTVLLPHPAADLVSALRLSI